MAQQLGSFREDAVNWVRGLLMGAADIVPGVSGGTVALILGHYERLVTAISHVDGRLFGLIRSGQLKAAIEYLDLRFLIGLLAGIATGILALASLMHYLLEHQQAYTYAVFFGLILGSTYLVSRRLKNWNASCVLLAAIGAVAAWQLCVLQPIDGSLTLTNVFFSAVVAICAMILPGISGAFILLLLGMYHPITGMLKEFAKGNLTVENLTIIAVFLTGCLIGLIAFSRVLKWLLAHHHDRTMAFLVGLMVGSLYKIWPFQIVTPETAGLPFKEQNYVPVWPSESGASWIAVILLAILAVGVTLALERIGEKLTK